MNNNIIFLKNTNLAFEIPPDLDSFKDITTDELRDDEGILKTEHTIPLIDYIKRTNRIPFNKGEYVWSSDYWDFSAYSSLSIPKNSMTFNFERCAEPFREEIKTHILVLLLENKLKIQTINLQFSFITEYFNYLFKKGFVSVRDVDHASIKDYLESKLQHSNRLHERTKIYLKKFYVYYSIHYEDILTKETWDLLMDSSNVRAIKAERSNSKYKDIPEKWFNDFIKTCLTIIKDESESIVTRGVAGEFLIMSQTGLRIGEVLSLEINNLRTVTIFNGETAYYLKYKTWKNQSGNNSFTWNEIYINEISKLAYTILTELYKPYRKEKATQLLFLGDTKYWSKRFPLCSETFNGLAQRFYSKAQKYMNIINVPEGTWYGLEPRTLQRKSNSEDLTFTAPRNHQYRVHVCSELYKAGVPLEYISKFMSHLTEDMKDYYPKGHKRDIQEDSNFSMNVIEKLVTGDLKPLGGKNPGELCARINKFLDDNNLNVVNDIDEIVDKLMNKIPIRQKTGGVCIKSSKLRDCAIESATNEFYCAYGVCPNLYHFFYMANVSYRQVKELEETININKNVHIKQAKKELNMLQSIVKNKLIPELDELKAQVNEKGLQSVIMEYPDTKEIIENLEDIYKEAEIWLTMTL